jgi:DNA-binding transcriptional LysR family regulator
VHLALNDRPVDLVGEGLDLEVRVGRLRDSNFIARQFASVRRVVCGASAYFERHGVPQVPADLIDHNCLLYTQQTPKDKWKFKGPEGDLLVRVAGDFEAMVGDAVRMAAIHGLGLIQLATHMIEQDLKAGRLRAVLTEYEPDGVPIYAVYPHRRHLSSTVRTFVEFLHARFQPKPDWVRGR